MENEVKDIGYIFKEKFKDFEEIPHESTWKKVEKQIPNKMKWLKIGGIIGVAAIITAGITIYALSPKSPQPKENIPTVEPEKVNHTKAPLLKENNTSGFPEFQTIFNSNPSQNTVIIPFLNSPQKPIHSRTQKEQQEKKSEIYNPQEITKIIENPELPSSPKNEAANQVHSVSSENTFPTLPVISTAPAKEEKPVLEQPKKTESAKKEITTTDFGNKTSETLKETKPTANSSEIYIPSAFTPGVAPNDIFKAQAQDVKDFEMHVFDKSGKQVFTSKDINQGWTGDNANSGTYIYVVKCLNKEGHILQKKGSVTLIRY